MRAPHTIKTVDGGEIEADNVVVATHLPFLDRTGHFTVNEPARSYVVAATLTDPSKMIKGTCSLPPRRHPPGRASHHGCITGMYITMTQPETRSLRPYDDGTGNPILIVCGNDHPAGDFPPESEGGAESKYADLEKWTRTHFPVKEIVGKWSAFDFKPVDKLPYIGLAHHGTSSVYTGTGFQKWGHTNVRSSFM